LLVKLGVVLVVPVVGALVLGVLRVKADVDLAESYEDVERVAAVRVALGHVLTAVQVERNEAVGDAGALPPTTAATDAAVTDLTAVVREASDEGTAIADTTSGYAGLARALDSLPAARRQRAAGGDGLAVLGAYNAVTNTVLEFDRSLVGRFPDEELTSTSIALGELQAAREQVALQQAVGTVGLREPSLSDVTRQLMVESDARLDDQLGDFRTVAPPALRARYDATVTGQDVAAREEMVDAARTVGPAQAGLLPRQWTAVSDATTARMTEVTERAATDLRSGSFALAESVSNRAGLESVLLLVMVLLAAGVGGGLGRYLLRSVALLRRAALDVAHTRLPAAVASIRSGEAPRVAIDPVPLGTTEEFGQLARAFDAVHDQAIRSAAEEANLRSNLANIFTNLSRRSQGLVERQLRLMEQLEQRTDDPDQLANLFRIDHLATRMRRNNENLMVLSGTGMLRRFTEAVPLADVLRAAISEVEHYERAVVRSTAEVLVAGYAAGDLIRSVSELIENATAFSPPQSQVLVESRQRGDGSVMIDVLDQGVGIAAAELREANHRVAGGGGVDVPVSRQMGLFVVGRLTARHGIRVRLTARAEGGTCASVLVPAGLVTVDAPGQSPARNGATTRISAPAEPAPVETAPADLSPVELSPVEPAPVELSPVERSLAGTPAPVEIALPVTVPSPVEVAGRLESAGISVRLSDLPAASTPAAILFAPNTPAVDDQEPDFAWLHNAPATGGAAPRPAPTAATPAALAAPVTGPNGLPKRVPKGQLLAPAAREQPPAPATRDAARARGFLNGFQSGVRQSENRRGETGS
jgi:signal transduction histidine kinase